jgi:lipopolysaccharide export system protein LptA
LATFTPRSARSVPAAALLTAAVAFGGCWVPAARAAPPPAPPPLEVTGATRIEYDDAAQRWSLRGPRVIVSRGTTRIEAPEVLYVERTREVTLPAGGVVATPTLEVRADRIAANLSSRHLTAAGHVAGRFTDEDESSAARDTPRDWGTFSAERVELDDRAELRQIVAMGRVVVVRGDRRLSGDRIVYNHGTRQGRIDGHADMARGPDRLRADQVFADLGRGTAEATGHVLLDRGDVHGSADHGTYSEPEQRAVLSGDVKLVRGRDTLTADRATVLLDQETAIAEGRVELIAYPEGGSP